MFESSGRMQNELAKHGASAGYFAGGGEMRDRIRAFDWSKSPLGPIEEWPISLRTIVAVMLGNRYPMAVWWGRDSLQLYNDAFRPILGDKHPASLGSSGLAVWRESWEVLGPMARSVLDGGLATWHEHLLVPADRSGFGEEASFSFSYSPIPTDTGAVGGVLVTAKVQGERTAAEVKLHESEGRYLALFNSIDQGFCTLEVAFDESQKPVDYRFLEVSPSFERQTGIRNGAGRWMREIAPGQDEHWFEIYGRVALTGESTRFESYSTPLDRWWAVYAFRIQEPRLRRVGVLFNDITERKRIERH